jgi:hypothetical protein
MDTPLIVLTFLSLAAAIVFAASAWRARTDDRRRSAARVAALAAAIDAVSGDAPDDTAPRPVPVAAMFDTQPRPSVNGRPMMRTAVFAALSVALIVFAAMANRDRDPQPPTAAAAEAAPLELMTMRHARKSDALVVSGLVRNPAAGARLERVAAVVFAFDRSGGFVASSRADLDFTALAPGAESPFVVTVPALAEVGRYRVSFRTEAGVLPHVDRRSGGGLRASAN